MSISGQSVKKELNNYFVFCLTRTHGERYSAVLVLLRQPTCASPLSIARDKSVPYALEGWRDIQKCAGVTLTS